MNKEIAKIIDHTVLKAQTTEDDVKKVCKEAREYGFFSVCINPSYIPLAKKELEGSDVKVCTVIGFPLGANTSEVKAFETKDAILKGADEVDMVINIGALKDKKYDYVENDIKAVVEAADKKALVKVIIETCYLTDEEKKIACELSKKAGADYVKTSTGFGTGGSTPQDIKLMRDTVGPEIGVKASGGVRNEEDAKAVIEAGASRIGASSSVAVVTGGTSQGGY
ncbi:deoxyribose-phosphate aldolase [Alkalithermobacter paradoxus]|uniref:Deoxyribose-phosphate aldolase n=1 Tax=Alkalithermobacter paradoxus TaxID=29349 RepID=A0A1V4IA20_9FIRM|nr:deoxyribose-phosphate aldolase [[Clostridium] thermoalcaliphilum]